MKLRSLYGWTLTLLLLLTVVAFWSGCDGKDDDDDSVGQVTMLLTDAIDGEFQSIEITVTKVLLLSKDRPPHTLWEGSQPVNILELSEYAELFVVGEEVPAGLYDKLRLQVAGVVQAVDADLQPVTFALPGNKIDLNPRGEFEVLPGQTLYLVLDFDATKTLAVSTAGIFRPVVFVNVLGTADVSPAIGDRLVRMRGEIEDTANASFVLCHPRVADPDYCVDVSLADATAFKEANGVLTVASVVSGDVGETAVAYGRVDLANAALDAVVVEVGTAFLQRPVKGSIDAVNADELTLTVEDGHDEVPEQTLTVRTGLARVFQCDGIELEAAELPSLVNREARVDGIYRPETAESGSIDATILIVQVCEDGERQAGVIERLDGERLQAQIRLENQERLCAQFRVRSAILVEDEVPEDNRAVELRSLAFNELEEGWTIQLFGAFNNGTQCFDVNAAVAEPPAG
jgi:hypothetical protein